MELEESESPDIPRSNFLAIQTAPEVLASSAVVSSLSVEEYIQQNYKKEMGVSSASDRNSVQQPIVDNVQPSAQEVNGQTCTCHTTNTPKYLDLEPTLAMDWMEIAWDDLHLKERVGAGMFSFNVSITFKTFYFLFPLFFYSGGHLMFAPSLVLGLSYLAISEMGVCLTFFRFFWDRTPC